MEVRYSKQARKFLNKQGEIIETRIRKSIDKLPLGDVDKFRGEVNTYRLRIGDYRVLFTKEDSLISINKIDNRGQVYKS
jgi:mRNA interferase RelE/StbE